MTPRSIPACAIVAVTVFLISGCNTLGPMFKNKDAPAPAATGNPTAEQMVAYLNDNARRLQAIQCNQVAIDSKQANQNIPGLDGLLVVQKPRQFRLKGKVLGQPAVDLGSNQQEFWYWISKAEPVPYVFHCDYKAMDSGQVRMPIPIQPEMILAAMGISEYDPTKPYEVKQIGNQTELVEKMTSPQGRPVTRATVFLRTPAAPGKPQVLGHVLRDEFGKDICSVSIQEVQIHRQTGAILPQKIRFIWPSEQLEMTMRFGEFTTPEITPDRAQRLFTRQDLNNLPGFDLATWTPDEDFKKIRGMTP
ncbi:MAG: hypothetical protein ACKO9Z_08545 [Planctomycetota bacterium]